MIKRLPRFSEATLETLCADAGALCQRVTEDESGWDYLVEFAEVQHPGPADTHPPRKCAYVQVKSAENARTSCRVKLSNALRAVQSRQPWFIVLMVRSKRKRSVNVFATHVWEEHIRITLEAVRRAENEGKPLNRIWLTVQLQKEQRNNDLISWMKSQIDSAGSDYEQSKKSIFENVGYEDGYGTGRVTVEASNADELMRNFLGLGDGLKVTKFVYTPVRFGIEAPTPEIAMDGGRIHINPSPIADCEVRLRGPLPCEPLSFMGKVYSLALPTMKPEDKTLRFSAEFLEILWAPEGGKTNCNASLDVEAKHGLATFEKYATLNSWFDAGSIDLQIWADGRRLVGGKLDLNKGNTRTEWARLADTMRLLQSIAGPTRQNSLTVSMTDIVRSIGLRTFHEVMGHGSFRLEFEPLPTSPEKVTSLLYYFFVEVGEHIFYALVERLVTEDVMIEGRRLLTSGQPHIVESYVLTGADDAQRKMMHADYERYLAHREINDHPLGFGDIKEFIGKLANETDKPNLK